MYVRYTFKYYNIPGSQVGNVEHQDPSEHLTFFDPRRVKPGSQVTCRNLPCFTKGELMLS